MPTVSFARTDSTGARPRASSRFVEQLGGVARRRQHDEIGVAQPDLEQRHLVLAVELRPRVLRVGLEPGLGERGRGLRLLVVEIERAEQRAGADEVRVVGVRALEQAERPRRARVERVQQVGLHVERLQALEHGAAEEREARRVVRVRRAALRDRSTGPAGRRSGGRRDDGRGSARGRARPGSVTRISAAGSTPAGPGTRNSGRRVSRRAPAGNVRSRYAGRNSVTWWPRRASAPATAATTSARPPCRASGDASVATSATRNASVMQGPPMMPCCLLRRPPPGPARAPRAGRRRRPRAASG